MEHCVDRRGGGSDLQGKVCSRNQLQRVIIQANHHRGVSLIWGSKPMREQKEEDVIDAPT